MSDDTVAAMEYNELKSLFTESEIHALREGIAKRLHDLKEMFPNTDLREMFADPDTTDPYKFEPSVDSYEHGVIKGQLDVMEWLLGFLLGVSSERYEQNCKVFVNKAIAKLN